jgi:hypothetical protein
MRKGHGRCRWKGGARIRGAGRDELGSLYITDAGVYFLPVDGGRDFGVGLPLGVLGLVILFAGLAFGGSVFFAGGDEVVVSVRSLAIAIMGVPIGGLLLLGGVWLTASALRSWARMKRQLHQDTVDEDLGEGLPLEQRYTMSGLGWRVLDQEIERVERAPRGVRLVTTLGEDVVLTAVEDGDRMRRALGAA